MLQIGTISFECRLLRRMHDPEIGLQLLTNDASFEVIEYCVSCQDTAIKWSWQSAYAERLEHITPKMVVVMP